MQQGNHIGIVAGTLYAAIASAIPDAILSYAGKILLAVPLGFATAAGAWLFAKLIKKRT